jgi:hypothetical protein
VREARVEAHLRQRVEQAGGWCVKTYRVPGLPDRIVLMPGGRLWWVEVKTAGGRLSRVQRVIHRRLAGLGFEVVTLWSVEEVDRWIEATCMTTS